MGGPALSVRGVGKAYGPLTALQGVSLEFGAGEIHAILGENGAGKSTLVGVIAGFISPDRGEVLLNGAAIPLGRANDAKRLGIQMIHQHFTLVPAFTVAENLALADLGSVFEASQVARRVGKAREIAQGLGWSFDFNALVADLPVGVQQRIEILKALAADGQVILFDEPTAVLSPSEVEELFGVLRNLKDQNKIVVLIAHKLSEVFAVADQISVLRKGQLIGTTQTSQTTPERVANQMVGEMPVARPRQARVIGDRLHLEGVWVAGDRGEEAVRGATFDVIGGEILGVGGVDGNGQVELAEYLAGVRSSKRGNSDWNGTTFDLSNIRSAYIPQDRQHDGLAMGLSVQDNALVDGFRNPNLGRGPFLLSAAVRNWVENLIRRFSIRVDGPASPISSLSGGNQQKVVVARNLDEIPQLLIAVNPTRGLDLRATQFVHEAIRAVAEAGACVVLISTDLDELYALSDRTLFLSRGQLAEDLGAVSLVGAA